VPRFGKLDFLESKFHYLFFEPVRSLSVWGWFFKEMNIRRLNLESWTFWKAHFYYLFSESVRPLSVRGGFLRK